MYIVDFNKTYYSTYYGPVKILEYAGKNDYGKITENKYFKQITELTKLYGSTQELYKKLANLEKKGLKDSEEYNDIKAIIAICLDTERKYFSKAVEYNLNRTMTEVLYKVVRGQLRPTYGIIFMLRKNFRHHISSFNYNISYTKRIIFTNF